jgi:hypothetical protein
MSIKLSVHQEDWIPTMPFRISNAVWESFPGIVVELQDGELVGRGEAEGIYYFDETPTTMMAQVEQVAERVEAGAIRMDLLELLPPGGARNAIDAALWDLWRESSSRRSSPSTRSASRTSLKPWLKRLLLRPTSRCSRSSSAPIGRWNGSRRSAGHARTPPS